ncbi:hypothetical protein DCCM_3953 [Desulfocucumis palustris]|uniref:Uncharacterized protein n=1 Tax=Desulfocucumis palustris TaxID=1898651 RepID=A0A2L2XGI9_9FIRM|nr:hypothetical protein [Desulfocucumis palustris]GBF34833.1 hypothetical protein DCCM_3953 [Desulfocucumis palustris]
MHHCNPFIQHAMHHGQRFLNDTGKAVGVSQSLVSACDEIILAINSGNTQGAVVAAQNARNMAVQVAQYTQEVSRAINERMNMATYVMGRIQQHINEMSSALQSMRMESGYYGNPAQVSCQSAMSPYMA